MYSCFGKYRISSAELEPLTSFQKSADVTAWPPNNIFKPYETLLVLRILKYGKAEYGHIKFSKASSILRIRER